MEFYYNKLQGKIKEVYGSQSKFLKNLKMSHQTWFNKMNGTSFFTQKEMLEICDLLSIDQNEMQQYFFNLKIKKT